MLPLDHDYFARRAAIARTNAESATAPAIRVIQEQLARDYAELARLNGPPTLRLAL